MIQNLLLRNKWHPGFSGISFAGNENSRLVKNGCFLQVANCIVVICGNLG
jgi:hypothetical protein